MGSEPLTYEKLLADLRRIKDEIGPPLPEVRFSRYATALPTAEPCTDDMREMVERLGRVRVPAAFRLRDDGREVFIVHLDLLKGKPR